MRAREVSAEEQEGAIAQLGEHLLCKQGVVGSIPTGSRRMLVEKIELNFLREREEFSSVFKVRQKVL